MAEMKGSSHRKAVLSICRELRVTKEYCSVTMTASQTSPKLSGTQQPFIVLTDAVGPCRNLDMAAAACLCFAMSGASDGRFGGLGLGTPAGRLTPPSGG